MTPELRGWLLKGSAVLAVVGLAMIAGAVVGAKGCGRGCCGGGPVQILPEGIDAGPGDREIASRLDGAVQAEEARIRDLEAAHAREIAAMQDAERREFEAARARGRDQLAVWFKERTARILADGGGPALW